MRDPRVEANSSDGRRFFSTAKPIVVDSDCEDSEDSEDSEVERSEGSGIRQRSVQPWRLQRRNLSGTVEFPSDIALYLNSELTEDERTHLLSNPCQPSTKEFSFPKRCFGKQNRAFSPTWYTVTLPNGNIIERKWLVYSPRRDAMFCLWCFLFGVFVVKKSSGGSMAAVSSEWAQEGLSNWKNALHTIKEHAGSSSHCASAQFKELFLSGVRIDELLETGRIQARKEREQKIQKNREVLR